MKCALLVLTAAAGVVHASLVSATPEPSRGAASPEAPPASAVSETPRVELLGYARRIPFAWSASRDAPAFNLMIFPRDSRTAAGEFSLVSFVLHELTLRTAFSGLIELESENQTEDGGRFALGGLAGEGTIYWRGAFGLSLGASFDRWARARCARCAFEITVGYRHESEHYTGSNSGGIASDMRDRPYVGNAFSTDFAFSAYVGRFLFIARVANRFYLPDQSSYSLAPALDLHARYVGFPRLHPFISGYAEYQFGTLLVGRDFPDSYLLRALGGIALPSLLGDLMLFGSGDVGYRKGLNALTKEATLGFGVRLAIAAHP
ncbi:MAG TPA: hypothetical protein VFV94_15525 [Polyangiaceae bacterium]|nr:hypothetical protein [Polyangiaceae bacterium]